MHLTLANIDTCLLSLYKFQLNHFKLFAYLQAAEIDPDIFERMIAGKTY